MTTVGRRLQLLLALSLCAQTLTAIGSAWDDIYPDISVEGQVRAALPLTPQPSEVEAASKRHLRATRWCSRSRGSRMKSSVSPFLFSSR